MTIMLLYMHTCACLFKYCLQRVLSRSKKIDVQGGPKSGTPLVFELPFLLDALYLPFLFTHISF